MPRHITPDPARRHCPLHGLRDAYELAWIDFLDEHGNGASVPVLCAEWMGLPSVSGYELRMEDEQWVALLGHEHSRESHAVHIHPGAGAAQAHPRAP